MTTHNQPAQGQSGEEMVKRVLAVAELLSKGLSTEANNHDAKTVQKEGAKTQTTKAGVSS
jgi:hypothetical protein